MCENRHEGYKNFFIKPKHKFDNLITNHFIGELLKYKLCLHAPAIRINYKRCAIVVPAQCTGIF